MNANEHSLLEQEHSLRLEVERESRLKDEFLATLGYELRTPLNAILGWARLLEAGRLSSEEVHHGSQTLARNARVLTQLVDDLLDMSAMACSKLRVEPEETDLCEIVAAACETIQATADSRGLTLNKHFDPAACLIFGDPQRLQRVVWNLLTNAVKFTPRGGRIDVELTRANCTCQIRVSDTGIGIAPNVLPWVFDRFREADAAMRRRYPGLGLGLVIAKQIVELHGGTIRAESDGEGKGATFIVNLPRLAPREDRADPSEPLFTCAHLPAGPDLQGVRVLIVDDEPDSLELARQVLGSYHAQVATALSVEAALAMLHTFEPDVLISDLSMPGRDGYELIREVRAVSGPEKLPAAALTAFVRPDDAERVQDSGFQVHLAKPIEPEKLLEVVARLARRG